MIGKPHRIRRKGGYLPRRATKIPKSLLAEADTAYSLKIRKRDKHCQYPGCRSTTKLQNSHYHGRAIKSTRFDDDNCIALCWFHHFKSKDLGFEYQKQRRENPKHKHDGQYTLFMKARLGAKRFKALDERAKKKLKLTREYLENLIEKLQVKPHCIKCKDSCARFTGTILCCECHDGSEKNRLPKKLPAQ